MSAKKAEDETPADAVDLPFNLIEVAAGPALEHRAFVADVARAMAIAAENAAAVQQTSDQIAATVTGKSVNRILDSLTPAARTADPDHDHHSRKEP